MKQNTRFFTHTSAIWALYILGNAVITLPVPNADEFTFLGLVSALIVGFVLNLIMLPIATRLFSENLKENTKSVFKIFLCIIYIALAVFAVFCAADAFSDFTVFIKEIILKDISLFFISVILILVVAFFGFHRQEDALKFFLIAFWFVLAMIVFFFIATAFNFNLRNIFVFKLPEVNELFKQAKPYILNPVIPSALLCFYNAAVFGRTRFSAAVTGYIIGGVLLGFCVISSVLLFGAKLAGQLSYPYSVAVSTVSIGRLFTRLDGFSYYIYFAATLARITVCVFVVKACFEKTNGLFKGVTKKEQLH